MKKGVYFSYTRSALNIHASLFALERESDSILLMDDGVLYDDRMFDRLMRSIHSSVLLIDCEYSTANDDSVLIPLRDGKPFDFIKQWRGRRDWHPLDRDRFSEEHYVCEQYHSSRSTSEAARFWQYLSNQILPPTESLNTLFNDLKAYRAN